MKHGSPRTYTNHKCRCTECRAAWNMYVKARRAADPERFRKVVRERRWRQAGKVPTQSCDVCGEMFRAVTVHKAQAHGIRVTACGTITGYSRGCRCDACRVASRNAQRAYRARKRLKSSRTPSFRILCDGHEFRILDYRDAALDSGHALGWVKRGLVALDPSQREWAFDCLCGWRAVAWFHVSEPLPDIKQTAQAVHDVLLSRWNDVASYIAGARS